MKLSKSTLNKAVESEIISNKQAEKLWHFIEENDNQQSKFTLVNLFFYLGGFLAISSITVLFSSYIVDLGSWGLITLFFIYALGAFSLAKYFLKNNLEIPASLCFIFIIALTPLIVSSLMQKFLPQDNFMITSVVDFFTMINEHWILLEASTLLVSSLFFFIYRFPILLMPLCMITWYMFYSMPQKIFNLTEMDNIYSISSIIFGLLSICIAIMVDIKTKRKIDFSFWIYFFGVLALWLGITNQIYSELTWVGYGFMNLIFLMLGIVFIRRIFLILGALGIMITVGHFAIILFDQFKFHWMLMSGLFTMLGLGIIKLGIIINRNKAYVTQILQNKLPKAFKSFLEEQA
jgi:hypothetical protein